jgi:hypothetical protein
MTMVDEFSFNLIYDAEGAPRWKVGHIITDSPICDHRGTEIHFDGVVTIEEAHFGYSGIVFSARLIPREE